MMTFQEKMRIHQELYSLFRRHSRRELWQPGLFSLLMLAAVAFITDFEHSFTRSTLFYLGVLAIALIWFGVSLWQMNPQNNSTLQEIKKEGGHIIRIYPQEVVRYGIFSRYEVRVMDQEGRRHTVPTRKFITQTEVLAQLALLHPQALVGYDPLTEMQALSRVKQ